jgi:hypothetical protein
MATTEMKARIKAYSTRVWPFLLFIRRSATLALVIILLIIVFSPPLNKKKFKNFKKCTCRTFGKLYLIISRANRKIEAKQFYIKIVKTISKPLKEKILQNIQRI